MFILGGSIFYVCQSPSCSIPTKRILIREFMQTRNRLNRPVHLRKARNDPQQLLEPRNHAIDSFCATFLRDDAFRQRIRSGGVRISTLSLLHAKRECRDATSFCAESYTGGESSYALRRAGTEFRHRHGAERERSTSLSEQPQPTHQSSERLSTESRISLRLRMATHHFRNNSARIYTRLGERHLGEYSGSCEVDRVVERSEESNRDCTPTLRRSFKESRARRLELATPPPDSVDPPVPLFDQASPTPLSVYNPLGLSRARNRFWGTSLITSRWA